MVDKIIRQAALGNFKTYRFWELISGAGCVTGHGNGTRMTMIVRMVAGLGMVALAVLVPLLCCGMPDGGSASNFRMKPMVPITKVLLAYVLASPRLTCSNTDDFGITQLIYWIKILS